MYMKNYVYNGNICVVFACWKFNDIGVEKWIVFYLLNKIIYIFLNIFFFEVNVDAVILEKNRI